MADNPGRKRVHDGFLKVDVVETKGGKREIVVASDSISFLVFNKTRGEVLLVTQKRAPMIREDNADGLITEVAAGRFDRKLGVKDLVRSELEEELGVTGVADESIEILNSGVPLALSPGILTERQYLAYVEIEDSQINPEKRLYGAKEEGEEIIRCFVPVLNLRKMVIEDMKTWALVQWFLRANRL